MKYPQLKPEFEMSPIDADPKTPCLFAKRDMGMIGIATMRDIQELKDFERLEELLLIKHYLEQCETTVDCLRVLDQRIDNFKS